MIGFQGPLMAAVLSAFIGSFVPFYDLELDSWILEAVMNFLQSFTAKDAGNAKGGAGKLYRRGRQEEIAISNPKSAKTTPSEVVAAPGWWYTIRFAGF